MTPKNRLLVFRPVNVTEPWSLILSQWMLLPGTNGHGILHCSSGEPSARNRPEIMFESVKECRLR